VASSLKGSKGEIILIGGSVMDMSCTPLKGAKLILKTSNPGVVSLSFGGVARNVCEVLSRLLQSQQVDAKTLPLNFITAVGADTFGSSLKEHLGRDLKIQNRDATVLVNRNNRSAIYNCLLDETGELVAAVADMQILVDTNTTKHIGHALNTVLQTKKNPIIFLDSNSSVEAMDLIGKAVENNPATIFLDPTSVPKSKQAVMAKILSKVTFIKPNEHELFSIVECFLGKKIKKNEKGVHECLNVLLRKAGTKHVLLTQGPKGVMHATLVDGKVAIKAYPALEKRMDRADALANVTGCGDNFSGGFLFGLYSNQPIETCIRFGMRASRLALESAKSVSDHLNALAIESDQ